MAIPIFSQCGCVTCALQLRSIGGELEPGGDFTKLVNWVNAYDITTVPWGQCLTGYFDNATEAAPDSTAYNSCTGGVGYPTNLTGCVTFNSDFTACVGGVPCPIPTVYRSQFYLPFPTAYYVLAYGQNISAAPPEEADCGEGGEWLSQGCIYPQQADDQYPMIVSLPIPDNTLDATIQVQYYWLGLIQPGASIPGDGVFAGNMAILPDLSSLTPSNAGVSGFGGNWAASIGTPCYATPDDPFTDSDPP